MKAVLQRVAGASVSVGGMVIARIGLGPGDFTERGAGLVVLLGVEQGDTERDADYLAQKTVELRIFSDENGKMNRSITDVGGSIIVVSQFTLLADWKKGRRPGFSRAAAPAEGNRLYEYFVSKVKELGVHVETGSFGAEMHVALVNDGPVTLILEHQYASENKEQA